MKSLIVNTFETVLLYILILPQKLNTKEVIFTTS